MCGFEWQNRIRGETMISIYVDVLVCINILITYIFVVCTRVAANMPTNKWGVCIGALVGGLSSLIIFLGDIGIALSVLYKLIVAMVIVFVCFLPHSAKSFIKSLLIFFGVSILFGGVMYFSEITFKPHGIMYLNGTVYFDMDIKYLIGCTFIIYGVFMGVDYLLQRKASKDEIYAVCITFRGISVKLFGYVDTGNNLTDGLTGRQVFIGELSSLAPLFTYRELDFLKKGRLEDIPSSFAGKIRLIPCKTVGESALLPAFTPDKIDVTVNKQKKSSKNFSVAVVNKSLGSGEYNILLNKAIYDLV